jgi:heat shock protein HtpX
MDEDLERNQAIARRLVVIPAVAIGVGVGLVITVVGALLVAVPVAVLVGVAWAVGLTTGLLFTLSRSRPGAVIAATGSHPVTEADEPRLHNLVEGLCVGIGLEPPRLRIVEDPAPNALAVARAVDDADLVVTRGLIDTLSLVELEAVLAHELARIRRGEALVGVVAGSTLQTPLVGPIARAVVTRGEPIDTWSDLAAVEITRYPPALASALGKLATADPSVPRSASPVVAHLWIHGARAEGAFGEALARVYEIPPPVGQRIEVLEEL